MDKDYNGNPKEVYDEVQVKFDADCEFLTSYYRDELNAKGLDADYDVRIDHNGKERNPTYHKAESNIRNYLGFGGRNDESGNKLYHKDEWENDFKIWLLEHHIAIVDNSKLKIMRGLINLSRHKKM